MAGVCSEGISLRRLETSGRPAAHPIHDRIAAAHNSAVMALSDINVPAFGRSLLVTVYLLPLTVSLFSTLVTPLTLLAISVARLIWS